MVGVNIKFKGKDEAKAPVAAVAPTTIKVVDNAEIDRLNGELNKLRAENDRLKNQPGPTTKTIIDEKVVTYPYFVNFEIGETEIVNRERVNLSTIAQMIKQNPGKTILEPRSASPVMLTRLPVLQSVTISWLRTVPRMCMICW